MKKKYRSAVLLPSGGKHPGSHLKDAFQKVVDMIEFSRVRAYHAVNRELIGLYQQVGKFISQKIDAEGWGQGTVGKLSAFIRARRPGLNGFSASNLWRMRQFHDEYAGYSKLAPLVRELPWSHNLLILGGCKDIRRREFYLGLAARERWSKRELERQMDGGLFERVALGKAKLAPAVREVHPGAADVFKDIYLLDFLELPDDHLEADLQHGLVANLRRFLIELGRDFCFVGEQYPIQVGREDYRVDILFYHRGLQCLVAVELKTERFKPEHLGKMEFYLEALDRDVRKEHERPSIGVLLCATRDAEVVEYALSRSSSPALIAEYQTSLPDKRLLQRKLHEFYQRALPEAAKVTAKSARKRPNGKPSARQRARK